MATKNANGKMSTNEREQFFQFIRRINANQDISRSVLSQYLAGQGSYIDNACGYPIELSVFDYKKLIEREGVANRANSIFPSECWSVTPLVYETEAIEVTEQTPFEKMWRELVEKRGLYSKLSCLDEVSGIGHYGVMLIGTKNSGPLSSPFPGLDELGKPIGDSIKSHELTYLMPFDETQATIVEWEKNPASPRYGKPLFYTITLANPSIPTLSSGFSERVHWTRCLHVADGCKASDTIGTPRLKKVWNYIHNIRKILGGAGEMFWNGGFPGTSFEVPPELVGTAELNKESLKAEIESYVNGFQRYLALSGVQAKQLQPNIADPSPHLSVQMQALSIALEIPLRVFMGTEEARLASMNDSEAWNRRVHRRHDLHVTPNILCPCVERFVAMGIVPKPKQFYIRWPDVYSVSETDRADIAGKLVRALAEYVKSGASVMFPPLQFLTMIMDFSQDEAGEIILAAEEAVKTEEYKYLDDLRLQKTSGNGNSPTNGQPKKKPLGQETPLVKKGGTPARNEEGITDNENDFVNNPMMRCHSGGMPGYKYGDTGKCYTYTEGDDRGRKRARRKAHIQGAAIEISKHMRNMESDEFTFEVSEDEDSDNFGIKINVLEAKNLPPQQITVESPQVHVNVPEQQAPQVHVDVKIPEQQAPQVKIDSPVNISIPEQPSPNVHIEPTEVNVHVPEQPAPQVHVDVKIPEQPAPNVTVESPQVHVQLPEQPAPQVHVEPAQVNIQPAEIHIESPEISVHVPEQPTPIIQVDSPVNISIPEQPAPQVHVDINVPEQPKDEYDVVAERDSDGKVIRWKKVPKKGN